MNNLTKLASTLLPIAAVAGMALSIGSAAPASAAAHHAKTSARHVGRPLYDVAPQGRAPVNSDDPALTGGGSIGYNQNIYNW